MQDDSGSPFDCLDTEIQISLDRESIGLTVLLLGIRIRQQMENERMASILYLHQMRFSSALEVVTGVLNEVHGHCSDNTIWPDKEAGCVSKPIPLSQSIP